MGPRLSLPDEIDRAELATLHRKHQRADDDDTGHDALDEPRLRHGSEPVERAAGKLRRAAQLLLDTQQLVVLRNAVRATGGAGLDLPGAGRNRKIGDERVFRLTGTV